MTGCSDLDVLTEAKSSESTKLGGYSKLDQIYIVCSSNFAIGCFNLNHENCKSLVPQKWTVDSGYLRLDRLCSTAEQEHT